jgi:Fe-S-cluster-containing dehydrogenase component/DMSO reductase anchor subunit
MAHGDRVVRLPLLDDYLREQGELSAVDRFSSKHDELDGKAQHYHSLIPLSRPSPGEQYGFQVDLDRCTGCKACVTACHSLNGLEEDETWRFVGLLHGGTPEAPLQQTVTTACHHCVDPACLKGCPVEAYEKDPITGIVKHLDDQCIGCQYCTLTCPYEVPQYSAKKGIVRKCDMCSDRLSAGEAPACVQACPNEAISIRLVSKEAVLEDAQTDAFLPGAPSPGITGPTTTYKSSKAYPRNTLPADFYAVHPSHQHRPLVIMLVLTQLSAGAFCVDQLVRTLFSGTALQWLLPLHSLVALAAGLLALGASIFHLGRPLYAFRAVLGLRTSWLSREIVAFGVFANAAIVYAAVVWRQPLCAVLHCPQLSDGLAQTLQGWLGGFVALCGAAGVFCSVMVYHVTLRRFWSFARTGFNFLMTSLVLGTATTLFTSTLAGVLPGGLPHAASFVPVVALLWKALSVAVLIELAYELSILWRLRDKQQNDLKRSALLLSGALKSWLGWRVAAGVVGGGIVPAVALSLLDTGLGVGVVVCATLAVLLLLCGALLERSLFFAAVSAPRMPGGFG